MQALPALRFLQTGSGPQGTFFEGRAETHRQVIPAQHCCEATWGRSLPSQGS